MEPSFDVPDVLAKICAYKKDEVVALKSRTAFAELKARCRDVPTPIGFEAAIRTTSKIRPAIIAEVKKASPSKGVIRADFDPVAIAKDYQSGGAACLSVLTDGPGFQGSNAIFEGVRKDCTLPMLRKDFMLDPIQIAESRAMGADAILIILAMLDDDTAKSLIDTAAEFGMDSLIETHDAREIERALALGGSLIGINNRDLRTFNTTLDTFRTLSSMVPPDKTLIAESGIFTYLDVTEMTQAGAHGFLIGESLMRQSDIPKSLKSLQGLTN